MGPTYPQLRKYRCLSVVLANLSFSPFREKDFFVACMYLVSISAIYLFFGVFQFSVSNDALHTYGFGFRFM